MTRIRDLSTTPARALLAPRPRWRRRYLLTLVGVLLAAVMPTVARAGTVWTADAEQPAAHEWAESSANGPACGVVPPDMNSSSIQRVSYPSPVAQGKYAYKFQVSDGEDCWGERAELGQNNPTNPALPGRLFYSGQNRWISFQAYFPDNYQLDDTLGQSTGLLQLKQEGADGPPALGIGNGEGYLCMFIVSTWLTHYDPHCGDGYYALGMPAKDTWIKLTLHVYFSNTDQGFVAVYGDLGDGRGYRLLLPPVYAPTMKSSPTGTAIPSGARIGIYRQLQIQGTEDLYVDGFTVATSEASANANAFAPPAPNSSGPAASSPPAKAVVSLLVGAARRKHREHWINAHGRIRSGDPSALTASATSTRTSATIARAVNDKRRRVVVRERTDRRWQVVAHGWTAANGTFSLLVPMHRSRHRVVLLRANIAGIGGSNSVLVR